MIHLYIFSTLSCIAISENTTVDTRAFKKEGYTFKLKYK